MYAGNVGGELLVIDKDSLEAVKRIQAHRQNLKSLLVTDTHLWTASQDKRLVQWDRQELESVQMVRNAHRKAFSIIGLWQDQLMTVSYPCGEITLWDQPTLERIRTIRIPGTLTGTARLDGDTVYLASRQIEGIVGLSLSLRTPDSRGEEG